MEQVQLYHPMLLPMLLGLLGSLCIAIGISGDTEPVERKSGWPVPPKPKHDQIIADRRVDLAR